MVLVSSTLLCTCDELEDCWRWDFHEATWALCPEAVLKRLRDSLKLGPDSMVLSGTAEVSGSLYDWLDWKREEWVVWWGGEVYTWRKVV